MYRRQDHSGVFLGGLLTGLGVGALFGMIFAPRPGRETRQRVADSAAEWPDAVASVARQAQEVVADAVKGATDLLEQTGQRISEAARQGVEEARRYAGEAKDGQAAGRPVHHAGANEDGASRREVKNDDGASGLHSGPRPQGGPQGVVHG